MLRSTGALSLLMLTSCAGDPAAPSDPHSYANIAEVRMSHVALDLEVDFQSRRLRGTCVLDVEGAAGDLVLDTRDLAIVSAAASDDGESFREAEFELGRAHPVFGAPLRIRRGAASKVRVEYETSPSAGGLQWLEPRQTAGRERPFLYSQSQAIQARTWIPLQDSPGVRTTYEARIRTPPGLLAVMSAEMPQDAAATGEYRFRMPLPIPPYLIALAVGDLAFAATGDRTGVYAEPRVIEAAAAEFEDTEAMMQAVEALYGPYRWGRYDILVLPPAFPFGGMENPRLTFVSPTVIAGDKSLVSLIAHELAHSWSGNLVTNAQWRDFWLNEGVTTYLEARIQEEVYGPDRAAMEVALEVEGLKEELQDLPEADQALRADLAGRDPDEGLTGVPYVKGAMFLRTVEHAVGREAFDPFLRAYFDEYAFRSITTDQFAAYLDAQLLADRPEVRERIAVEEWLGAPGLPDHRHEPESEALDSADEAAASWLGGAAAAGLDTAEWTTQHWQRFIAALPDRLEPERMAELDRAFGFTEAGNAEVLTDWLKLAITSEYAPADAALRDFLVSVGRRKFLRPLYEQLAANEAGKAKAAAIYAEARSGYHPLARQSLDEVVGWSAAEGATP